MTHTNSTVRTLPASAALVLLLATAASAQLPDGTAFRSDWIPSGGYSEGALGDLWTFNCPSKGVVSIWVDTEDDTGDASSKIDPVIEVVDKRGRLLAIGDNNAGCTYTPECATSPSPCPRVIDVPCGKGNPHSLVIYSKPSTTCTGGGSYFLWIAAANKRGKAMKAKALRLGGGARRRVPKWASIDKNRPALDDEGVPSFAYPATGTFGPGPPPPVAEVTLAWDPTTSKKFDGYRLHYGFESRNYFVSEDVGERTTYTLAGLERGATYYFAVTVYFGESRSGYSNEVVTTIPLLDPE